MNNKTTIDRNQIEKFRDNVNRNKSARDFPGQCVYMFSANALRAIGEKPEGGVSTSTSFIVK